MSKKKKTPPHVLVRNRKAFHDYHIEERFEAGIALHGWEIKSIRANRTQLKESYVILKDGECWLIGAHMAPLEAASTHVHPDPTRTRKLLLHKKEIRKLQDAVNRAGYALVPLDLHWRRNRAKCEIAIAKGKKQYDKREASKQKDWAREAGRLMKQKSRA